MSVVLTAHFPLSGKTHDRLVDGSGAKAARAEFVAHSADPKTACLSAGGILKSESPVLRRLLVEVDDGEEIRGYVGLVLRPDVRPPPSSSPSTSWN